MECGKKKGVVIEAMARRKKVENLSCFSSGIFTNFAGKGIMQISDTVLHEGTFNERNIVRSHWFTIATVCKSTLTLD